MKSNQIGVRYNSINDLCQALHIPKEKVFVSAQDNFIIITYLGEWIDITIGVERNLDKQLYSNIIGHWEYYGDPFFEPMLFEDDDINFIKKYLQFI